MASKITMVRERQHDDEPVIHTNVGPCSVDIMNEQTVAHPINKAMADQLLNWGYRYSDSFEHEAAVEAEPEPEPTPTPDPEPEEIQEPDTASEFPILDSSVDALEMELRQGLHDEHLDALLECETCWKNRKTAIEAIERRMAFGEE